MWTHFVYHKALDFSRELFTKPLRFLLIALLALAACQQTPQKRRLRCYAGITMTVPYRILVVDGDSQCQTIIDETFALVDAIYNNWNSASEISRLNQAPAKTDIPLSPQLASFLNLQATFVQLTNGLFDPTIAPVQTLWKEALGNNLTPNLDAIEPLRAAVGWDKLSLHRAYARKAEQATSLDLGGVAKGYAIDLLVEHLEAAGYHDLYVSWGGEVRVTGSHPDERPWRVAVRNPSGEELPPLKTWLLNNQAMATSGDYEQFWTASDQRQYTHICDPHTLCALQITEESLASVTVIAETCALADALATAAMVTGSVPAAQQFADTIEAQLPGTHFLIVGHTH